eukprot:gene22046-28539_t
MTAEQIYDKIQILYTEMNYLDQNNIVDISINGLKLQEKSEKTFYHKDVAQYIKQELDTQKGGTWNVVVGQSFGSFVTHETKTMSHFMIGSISFLIWKHG